MIKYTICILTYKRPELLKILLNSLELQENIDKGEFEIVVIDNDNDQSAKIIVEQHLKCFNTYIIKYFVQPVKNLSISRNLAIDKSEGNYVLFIDDDEYADSQWAFNLIECISRYNADVVFGKLELSFETAIPNYLKNRDFYFPKSLPSGSHAKVFYSGNVIIKKSVLQELGFRFDEQYGLTGGEDSHLFQKIKDAGKTLIYTNEAIIFEYVPLSRGNLSYLLKRNFRSGNGYINRTLDLYQNDIDLILKLFIKSCLKLIFYLTFILFSFFNKKIFVKYIIKFSSVLGEVFAFFRFKLKMYK